MPRFKVTLHDHRANTNVVTYLEAPSITIASRDVWEAISREIQHHYPTSVERASADSPLLYREPKK